jgi:hypothetical protein
MDASSATVPGPNLPDAKKCRKIVGELSDEPGNQVDVTALGTLFMHLDLICLRCEDDSNDLITGRLRKILALFGTTESTGVLSLTNFPGLGPVVQGCRKLLVEEEKKEEEKRKKKIAKTQPKMAPKDNSKTPSSLAASDNGSLVPPSTGVQNSQNHMTREGRVGTDDEKSVLGPQTNNDNASKDPFSKASVPPESLMSSVPPASTTQKTN